MDENAVGFGQIEQKQKDEVPKSGLAESLRGARHPVTQGDEGSDENDAEPAPVRGEVTSPARQVQKRQCPDAEEKLVFQGQADR
jgi:hypothetical protein